MSESNENDCYKYKTKQLIFLGSSCVYPRNCKQPIKEEYLLSGTLEKSNEPYAIAKIAGIKNIYQYPVFNKKNQHIINTAQKFIRKELKINVKPNPKIIPLRNTKIF